MNRNQTSDWAAYQHWDLASRHRKPTSPVHPEAEVEVQERLRGRAGAYECACHASAALGGGGGACIAMIWEMMSMGSNPAHGESPNETAAEDRGRARRTLRVEAAAHFATERARQNRRQNRRAEPTALIMPMSVEELGSKALRVDEPGSKALVRAVEELDVELRAPSLMLHLAMWSVGAHHAVMHVRAKGKLACVATASAASACGASLLDGARESATAAIQALAARAMKRGAGIALSHGEAKQLGLAHGSALAMPLLPPEGDALGCITLASDDDARVWSPEEQRLVKHATPMFALYAQRALLREQAALLSALTPAEEREGRVIAARIEKATGELKSAHARQIEELMEEHNVSRRYSAELHKQAAEQRAIVDELRAQIKRLEDEAKVRTRRSDEQEREIERLDEMRKAQLAQLSQAHAAELSDARREAAAVPAAAVPAAAAMAETAAASGPPRGHHEVVTRPPPRQGASVVSSAAVRMLPEVDVPKSSRSVALPPLPSNWERKVYADGKVRRPPAMRGNCTRSAWCRNATCWHLPN